jgi:hypothetical protein
VTRELDVPRFKRYLTSQGRREIARERRDRNRDAQRCVNENLQRTHGPATHGVRCAACHETHRGPR